MHFAVDSQIPPSIVLLLVCLALLWGVIVACYIADVAWAVCFAQSAINSMQEAHEQREASHRRPVFVVGDDRRRQDASQHLIRTV